MSLPAALQPPPAVARIARFLEAFETRHRGVLPVPMVTGDVASFTEWIGMLVRPTPVLREPEAVREAERPASVAKPDFVRPPQEPEPAEEEIEREVRVHELIERSETVRLEQGLLRRRPAPPLSRSAPMPAISEIVQVYPTFATYLLTSGKGAIGAMGVADTPVASPPPALAPFVGAPPEVPTNAPLTPGIPLPFLGTPSASPGMTPTPEAELPRAEAPGELAVRPPIGFAWNEPVRRDVLGAFGGPARAEGFLGVALGDAPIGLADPLFGQITLVAPPVRAEVPGGGAVEFAWRDLERGIGPLDEGQMEVLRTALPEGTRALYPAVPRERLGGNAVNLRIAPSVVETLVERGYGDRRLVNAQTTVRQAQDFHGGTPAAMPLAAHPVAGALPERALRRQRTLDVAGASFELATTLGGATETRHLAAARLGYADLPRAPILNVTGFDRFDRRVLQRFNRLDPAPLVPSKGFLALPSVAVPALASAARHAPPFASVGSVSGREAAATLPLLASLVTRRAAPGAPTRGVTGLMTRTATASPALPPLVSTHSAPSATSMSAVPGSRPAPAAPSPTFGTAPRLAGAPASPAAPRVLSKGPQGPIGFNVSLGRPANPIAGAPRAGSPARSLTTPKAAPGVGTASSPPRFGGSMGAPTAVGLRAATPSMPPALRAPQVPEAATFRESHVAAPAMALPAARSASPDHAEPVMVQASTGGAAPVPTASPVSATAPAKGGPAGGAGSEVNALANEVWTLLKRRLAFENQRAGGR